MGIICILCPGHVTAQFGPLPPYSIELHPIKTTKVIGLHSFAFAQHGSKWLFVGGRINGLHGINSNDGFPGEYANNYVIVIDTNTWQTYSSNLSELPKNVADPLRSTNMQYLQKGAYLYLTGGYGIDSTIKDYVTFPTLTAIPVSNMIDSVVAGKPILSLIRQVNDTNLAVCGGEMISLGNQYGIVFGHHFKGRYSHPPTPLFTQKYTDQIRRFNLTDNGNNLAVSGFVYETDTNNYHRRDLNVVPAILTDGSEAYRAFGGVFRKDKDLPFEEPVTISAATTLIHQNYKQQMSHYTCALLPLYDSISKKMYTTFFGGISLNDYQPNTNTVKYDTLVPFISDITTLTVYPDNSMSEAVMPQQLTGLLGANAKFILNRQLPHYSNEVIKLHQLPPGKIFAGYLFGGIRARQANNGISTANDTIYRVYLTKTTSSIIATENSFPSLGAMLYPNPANIACNLVFHLDVSDEVIIQVHDINAQLLYKERKQYNKGNSICTVDLSSYAEGVYFFTVLTNRNGASSLRLLFKKQ